MFNDKAVKKLDGIHHSCGTVYRDTSETNFHDHNLALGRNEALEPNPTMLTTRQPLHHLSLRGINDTKTDDEEQADLKLETNNSTLSRVNQCRDWIGDAV